MNKRAGISAWVAIGLALACLSMPGFSQSVINYSDGFEGETNNTPIATRSPTRGWLASSSAVRISTNAAYSGSNAVYVAGDAGVSNVFQDVAANTNAWTDFWVQPAFFDAGRAPDAYLNCSAQFFVNYSGCFVLVYGVIPGTRTGTNGFNAFDMTNVVTGARISALAPGTWAHLSILNNYGTKQWSIFLNDQLIATNLPFISSAPQWYKRFQAYSFGTNAWMDGVTVLTNQVPATLSSDGDGDGMFDAWELTYFGYLNVANPALDPDGDGLSNLDEAANRSDPFNRFSPNNPDLPSPYLVSLPYFEYFDSVSEGSSIYGVHGWNANPMANMTAQSTIKFQGKSVQINDGDLSLLTVTNAAYTNIWTAFVMSPSTNRWMPTLKPDSTVSFYIGADGYVHARSNGVYVTLSRFLGGSVTNNYPPIKTNDWVRFIVNSDYSSDTWSLWMVTNALVNTNSLGRLLAHNLAFDVPAASYGGLTFGNLNPQNIKGYMDNVEITLSMTEWVDSDGDGVPDLFEIEKGMNPNNPTNDANQNTERDLVEYGFGTTDPRAGVTNLDLQPIAGPPGSFNPNNVRIGAVVGSNRTVTVMASTSPTGPFSPLASFYTGTNAGDVASYVHTNAVLSEQYYYYLTSRPRFGDSVATDSVVRVMHRQARPKKGTWYMAGVPVDYGPGSNNFGSTLGTQLSRGLMGGDNTTGDRAYVMKADGTVWKSLFLNSSGAWQSEDATPLSSIIVSNGYSIWIERRALDVDAAAPFNAATNTVLCGQMNTNASYSVMIMPGWNMLSWPYEQSRVESYGLGTAKVGWGFYNNGAGGVGTSSPNTADLIWVRRSNDGGYDKHYLLGGYGNSNDGRWWKTDGANRNTYSDLTMRPGTAFFYYHRGAGFLWTITAQ